MQTYIYNDKKQICNCMEIPKGHEKIIGHGEWMYLLFDCKFPECIQFKTHQILHFK